MKTLADLQTEYDALQHKLEEFTKATRDRQDEIDQEMTKLEMEARK